MPIEVGDFFFGANQPIGTAINVLILGVGGVALFLLVRSWRKLRGEQHELRGFAAALHVPTTRDEILQAAKSLQPDHILPRRIETLGDLKQTGADIDPSALSAIASAELERQVGFSRWAASTAVLLGLGGTLVGLTQAVMAATPLLRNITTSADAVQAVLDTFSGLSTAFSTTLMGIIWAVVLGGAVSFFRREQGRYLQHLEEVSLVQLLPYFRTSASLAMVEAARSLSELERQLSTELKAVVGEMKTQGLALTKTVEDSLEDVVGEARIHGKALSLELERSFNGLIGETQTRGLALVSTVDRSLETLASELRLGSERLLGSYAATNERLLRFIGEPGADSRTLAENLQVLHGGVTALQGAAEALNRMTPSIEEAIARQVDRQSRDLHETMHAYVERLAEGIERQDAIIDAGLVRLREGIPGFAAAVSANLESHAQALGAIIDNRTQSLVQATDHQSARLSELRGAVAQLVTATEALRNRATQDDVVAIAIKEASVQSSQELRGLRDDIGLLVQVLTAPSRSTALPPQSRPMAVHIGPAAIPEILTGNGAHRAPDDPPPAKPAPKNLFRRWFG